MKLFLFAFLLLGGITVSCFDDQDDNPASENDIKRFIWNGLNLYYLYLNDVPDLADDRFSGTGELDAFSNTFDSPEDWFYQLIAPQDRFSWIVSDYIALEQSFSGVTLHNGMDFGITYAPNDTDVIGFVKYVLPGSNAQANGVQRGMIFNAVDGTTLTVNNFQTLLSSETYTIDLAELNGIDVNPTGTSITLTKAEFTENPIYIADTFDVNGTTVGYLMYNQFTGDFDDQLNSAFANFQAAGVSDFILDLRYNSGGSVTSAINLSSMITGQFNGDIFTTEQWNHKLQEDLFIYEQQNGVEILTNRFTNVMGNGSAINSLNLNRVYILTTSNSASASELVISALTPYIDVIQIGSTTTGKYQASVTLYDSSNFSRDNVNPGHTYAMQPLVLKEVNAAGFTDYDDGLTPDPQFILNENLTDFGVLGDQNEPLLARAIQHISGLGFAPENVAPEFAAEPFYHSDSSNPISNKMFIDKELPEFIFQNLHQ
ncbi:MAG: peptidase S41 [Flavobacteriaceae bacterium]|nr:peptidase S41 [Flavobacteriaceae bacterium]